MCGIAGFEVAENDARVATQLSRRLARRGPDGDWFQRVGGYGLVQTRLSVIDLSARVRYPMCNESGELHLLFNGEIYDHRRERAALERRGHRFATDCDAEVVVHGYEEWGTDVFARLDGMFAVAILHAPTGKLVLARDALGIKPLVYTTGNPFAFASDAVALVQAGLVDGAVDHDVLSEYLAFHYVLPPRTGLANVVQLEPGEMLTRGADGRVRRAPWRAKPFTYPSNGERVEIDDAARILDRSVQRQLIADVPVGVFLSSGVDSSLVLDSAVRAGATPRAFTVSFPGQGDYDELPGAARFARHIGVPHEMAHVTESFGETVAGVSGAFDQPLGDASSIATMHLARLARSHVTVALSGTGGDDLFAGYYRHRAHLLTPVLGRLPASLNRLAASGNDRRGSERRSLQALGRSYVRRLAAVSGLGAASQYAQLVGSSSSPLAAQAVHCALEQGGSEGLQARLDRCLAISGSTLRGIQALELGTYLPGDLLTKEDRSTMAVGLEARVPLLGAELLELAERTPDGQKMGLLSGKRLLRQVASRRLPRYVTSGRKRGFAVPLKRLFAGGWAREATEWFASTPSSLVDGPLISQWLSRGEVPVTDAWALAALVGWENTVREARLTGSELAAG